MRYFVNSFDRHPILITEVAKHGGYFIYSFRQYGSEKPKVFTLKEPHSYWIQCTPENYYQEWQACFQKSSLMPDICGLKVPHNSSVSDYFQLI
jgi:hypothetical protein